MSFQLFTPLFQKIDQVTTTFVTEICANTILAITPVVSIGLTLAFMAYGLLVLQGSIEMPVHNFIARSFRIAVIVSLALTGGLYQAQIAQLVMHGSDELAYALVPGSPQTESPASLLDHAAGNGFDKASQAFEKAGHFEAQEIVYGLFGITLLLATGIMTAIGGAYMVLIKLVLALLAGLGPLFIVALLWQSTSRFFAAWIKQILSYALLLVFLSALLGLIVSLYSNYMADLQFDGAQNVSYGLGGAVILAVLSIIIFQQLPTLARALANGVSLAWVWKLQTNRRS